MAHEHYQLSNCSKNLKSNQSCYLPLLTGTKKKSFFLPYPRGTLLLFPSFSLSYGRLPGSDGPLHTLNSRSGSGQRRSENMATEQEWRRA